MLYRLGYASAVSKANGTPLKYEEEALKKIAIFHTQSVNVKQAKKYKVSADHIQYNKGSFVGSMLD